MTISFTFPNIKEGIFHAKPFFTPEKLYILRKTFWTFLARLHLKFHFYGVQSLEIHLAPQNQLPKIRFKIVYTYLTLKLTFFVKSYSIWSLFFSITALTKAICLFLLTFKVVLVMVSMSQIDYIKKINEII